MNGNVYHPSHYNIPGKKECWDDMEDRFGREFVKIFCKANYFKYRFRSDHRNGFEDILKAENYNNKFHELGGTEEEFWKGMEDLYERK